MTLQLLLVFAALGLGGFVKGATGIGLPLVSIPALVGLLGVPHTLALLTVPLLVTNAWQVWRFYPHRDGTGFLLLLVPAGMIGVGIGTWALTKLPLQLLSLTLAGLIVFYIGLHLTRPHFRVPQAHRGALSAAVGLVAGALQATTGISGPVSVTFIHALGLTRDAFVFAVSVMFLLFTVTQLGALTATGLMGWRHLLEGCLALVPITIMMPLGSRAAALLSREAFDRLILALLAVIALKLVFDSVSG